MKIVKCLLMIFLFSCLTYSQQDKSLKLHLLSDFVIDKKSSHKKIKTEIVNLSVLRDTLSLYEIKSIDSLGNYYLIEAKNDQYEYRILSMKGIEKCTKKIEVGGIYHFDLRDIRNKNSRIHIDPQRVSFPLEMSATSLSSYDVVYYDLFAEWRIKLGLYNRAENLIGLQLCCP